MPRWIIIKTQELDYISDCPVTIYAWVNPWALRINVFSSKIMPKNKGGQDNLKVQLLLRKDMKFLDDIQLQMSTAREFMFAYRLTHESEDGALATLNRIEKHISDQGFDVKRANKEDIKRFLSRYFGHMVEDSIDDVDGERMIKKWIIPD